MADENRVTYIVSWNRVRRVVLVVVGGKKVLIQRLPLTRARAPAVGIGQWQQVAREERERNVNEREKLSYFVWKYLGLYLGDGDWSYRFETKKGKNIFRRVSFFTKFSLSEKKDDSCWLKFASRLFMVESLKKVWQKMKRNYILRLHEWIIKRIFDIVNLISFF